MRYTRAVMQDVDSTFEPIQDDDQKRRSITDAEWWRLLEEKCASAVVCIQKNKNMRDGIEKELGQIRASRTPEVATLSSSLLTKYTFFQLDLCVLCR